MRMLLYFAFFVFLLSASGCDAEQGALEDTLPDVYTLTTDAAPDTGGSILPSEGEYITGQSIEIEARPAEGYIFDYWEGDLSGNNNPEELNFSSNKSVTAYFTERDYDLNIEITGEGSVRETVIERSAFVTVSLAAEADSGWIFDRWEGDLMGSENPETITIEDEEKSVRAVFVEYVDGEYNLSVSVEGEGSISKDPNKSSYTDGDEVELTAQPASGWSFSEWEGALSGSTNPGTVLIDEDKSVTAIFVEDVAGEYNLSVSVEGEGSVSKDPNKSSYTDGDEVELTAQPASGWSFSEWEGALSGSDNPETIVMDEDKSVTAVFEQDAVMEINVNEVKLFITEMEIDGARRTDDFSTSNFVLNLPLDGTRFRITHTEIPAGFYDELELEIEKPENSDDVDDSDFIDGSNRYSLVAKGAYNGQQFIFRSMEDFEIGVDIRPHLEITEGQNRVIAIDIDFKGWFMNSSGEILDPSDSGNSEQINENIEDSFSDFEDEF